MSWSEYYCCCLRYPPFPSLPLTARQQLQLGYFYFCSFLLLWGGSNSNWTSASGLARDGQVRARATDGERKSGKTRNNLRIKESGFASMTGLSSFFTSPVYVAPLSVCFPACLWVVPSFRQIDGPGLYWSARFGFTLESLEKSCVPFCLLVGRWRVSWTSPQGWRGTFFPQICTCLAAFPTQAIGDQGLNCLHWNCISLNFLYFVSTDPIHLAKGHLKESFFFVCVCYFLFLI